ncbi:MAG: hypothetical protein ABL998_17870, partial [Planctomycetota bacterium]
SSVRLACVRALEFVRGPGRAEGLLARAFDPDERVRRAARNGLLGLPADEPGRAAAQAALCARVAAEEPEAAFARLCDGLLAAGLGAEELLFVRAAAPDAGRAALAEALAFAAGFAGEPQVLARGLAAASDEDWDPVRARVVAAAGRARSVELARALLSGLADGGEASLAREARRALLVASLPRASAFELLRASAAPPELLAEVVPALAAELEQLDADVATQWLAPEQPEVLRASVVVAAAAVFTRAKENGSERVLARALLDPAPVLVARAFEVLASATTLSAPSEAALHDAFRAFPEERQVATLGDFTRERAFSAWRDDWLALGERVPATRAALGELLGALREDTRAAQALARWLTQDLAECARGPELARDLEQRVQAELRALARLAPTAVAEFARALTLALGRSSEIGKRAVMALGRTQAGRDELAARLARGDFAAEADRRTRIEAGIQLATVLRGPARRPASALLFAERENAAWDLRERVLAALASGAEEELLGPLGALLLAPETEPVERAALATLLPEYYGERAAPLLLALLASIPEIEARRSALPAFAGWPGSTDAFARWAATLTQGDEASAEERALLAGEARVVLASVAPTHPLLVTAWLTGPRARAGQDLAARLAGRELSSVEFAWRQELEIARRLARNGTLAPALAAAGEWWQLDGRLLAELGLAALEGDAARARELTRAALLARLGERDPDERELLRLEARLCALAARAGDEDEVRARLARLLAARRAGELGDSDWSALLGTVVPQARDPERALRARVEPVPR